MQDLRILSSQQEFEEFLNHAKDVLPSKRSTKWKEMTLDMGLLFLKRLKGQNGMISDEQKKTLDKISNWPVFKKSDLFRDQIRPLRLKELHQCFGKSNQCLEKAQKLIKLDRDPEYLYQILKILLKKPIYLQMPQRLQIFIDPILTHRLCSFYINKAEVKEVLTAKIMLNSHDLLKIKITQECKNEISKSLLESFYYSPQAKIRAQSKDILYKWGALHSYDIYFYNILQFLSNYKFEKKLLFVKWKTFKTLGRNQSIREIVLSKLYKRKFLEGLILKEKTKSATAITKAIARYIPEYFNHFANQCIKYFEAKREAPSLYCHDLFKRSKEIDLFAKSKTEKYERFIQKINKKSPTK